MKRFLLLFSILSLIALPIYAEDSCFGTSCMPEPVQDDCTVMESNGCIDWTNGIIYATGMGVPNPNFPTQAQKTYSAYQAAKVVAMRNLLQVVEGIHITSTRTVKAGMLEDDTISTQISGRLKHVMEAGKPRTMNDGSVWVTMKMYMRDIISILVGNQQFGLGAPPQDRPKQSIAPPPEPKAEDEKATVEGLQYGGKADIIYTGLILDASGTSLTPAMSPKVYDPDGREIYGSAAVDREFVLESGIAGYVKELEKAKKNDRVGGSPLLIRAKPASEDSSDLVISEEDARLLEKLDASQSFLREARVLIIIG